MDIAQDELTKYDSRAEAVGIGVDRDIDIIYKFLRRGTRNIDLSTKNITYNKLNSILRSRGFELQNPKGNRIDVMKKGSDGAYKRVAHVGFHGWSKEVSRKDVDIVREATRLDAAHGYDSQSFFNGLEDPLTLIEKYKQPLERLAFR